VLPVMGAVPDGAIVIFSGLGPDAQNQLAVGVGTLAGSTIMLLTVSWALCTFAGRVDVVTNAEGQRVCNYKPRRKGAKLTKGWAAWDTGVEANHKVVKTGAWIMFATSLTYFLIQGPAFAVASENSTTEEAKKEHGWAIAGFVVAALCFLGYSAYQVLAGEEGQQEKKDASLAKAAVAGKVSLEALLSDHSFRTGSTDVAGASRDLRSAVREGKALSERDRHNMRIFIHALFNNVRTLIKDDEFVDAEEAEIMIASIVGPAVRKDLDIEALMHKYGTPDAASGAHVLTESGFEALFTEWFIEYANSRSGARRPNWCRDAMLLLSKFLSCGVVTRGCCCCAVSMGADESDESGPINSGMGSAAKSMAPTHMIDSMKHQALLSSSGRPAGDAELDAVHIDGVAEVEGDEDFEDEEEDEEEDESGGLTRGQIFVKALSLMIFGVIVVTLFSDPMVGVLTSIGDRLTIPPFYVSFIVTPLVSNASELISSLIFAMKRSKKSITLTFSQLMGAATMNNTFVLSLFLGLCAFRQLAWTFSAEVMAIFLVQVVMTIVAMQRVQTTGLAYFVMFIYPLSIFLVFALETWVGWT
jgi:hypothetical protein